MKAVLGLVILSCFVVGSLGVACNPDLQCVRFKECACANNIVVKARVIGHYGSYHLPGQNALQEVYFIETLKAFKPPGNTDRKYFILIVPTWCDWQFKIGGKYFFFGHQYLNIPYIIKMGRQNGYKKYLPNATQEQKKFLRQISKGWEEEEEACAEFRDDEA